jgi:hypothetical protein
LLEHVFDSTLADMETQKYVFELPDGRTVTSTRIIQRNADGRYHRSMLTDGRISLAARGPDVDSIDDGEPLDDAELEQLARRYAGFNY